MFLRMPFGISSASEVQQRKTMQVFGDLEGVHVMADDTLIAAANEEDHDRIMCKVMDRARQHNVKFKQSKTQFKKSEVKYMGVVISAEGLKPDETKIRAILDMPDPTDRAGLQRLIGMLNFLSPFIPDKSSVISPLRNLLKSDVPWHCEHEHKDAMAKLKDILSAQPVLKLYEPD